ncbi:hypothetical protein PRIPAC_81161, partial [Pristionchus pacificus]
IFLLGMSSLLPCIICSAPTNFTHFGINACRSCGDFYKRSVNAGRTFVCRQGNGNCTINQKDRHNCRGCRFEKCKRLGMKLVEQIPAESIPIDPSTSLPDVSTHAQNPLLSRISSEYLASVARRKICEFTLQPTSLHRHVKADFQGEDLLLVSFTFLMDCLKLYAGDYMHFATSCFPEFAELSLEDQRLMLKNFASRLYTVESHCGTFRKFGSHEGPFYMGTLTAVHDARRFQFFTEEEDPTSNEEIVKLMNYYTDKTKRMLGPILSKSKFTDTEYDALFALSVWQIDPNQNMPDHIIELSVSARRTIFDAMKEYYQKELNLVDYSVRLGNLISFEHTIQECTNILDEEVQAYNLTGLLNADVSFLQIVLQISL